MARTYHASDFDALFARVLADINTHPEFETAPRGMKIREVIAPTLVLSNPRARLLSNKAREANYGFAVGEFLWYRSGRDDLETMLYYNKRMKDFSDDGKTLNSAYGKRIFSEGFMSQSRGDDMIDQWRTAFETLVKDPDSRRAVIVINQPYDQFEATEPRGSKDVPCTLSLQFFIRHSKVVLHAHMRSNDAVWGLTYDLFSFTLLQEMMLLELKNMGMHELELGDYIHTAGSLHIYERHFGMASAVVENYLAPGFEAAAPMDPFASAELATLLNAEEALRTGKVAQLDEALFSGGARWMAAQLNAHRRKRDDERGR